ncbi:MAG TPA: 4-hydroxyproline epimerase [Blastocatellia bacterium]|nr:4-hydroxyproline epimerase [Blastocatellia bacterium]
MTPSKPRTVRVVDSHTGGEPTRVIIEGGPDLGRGSLAVRLDLFKNEFDSFRSAVVNEPRGSDAIVGAMLCQPTDPSCAAGVIFFNNVGYLGMCGHGTIGVVATLAYLGRIKPGRHVLETPVGPVAAELHEDRQVTVSNVPSYRARSAVTIDVPGYGRVSGDIAWGGNWFFLVSANGHNLSIDNLDALTEFTWQIRQTLNRNGITGDNGQEIDHIELFTDSNRDGVDSKNFVLCPGKAYDRSPCGTGTSAKMACLYADGKLKAGQVWRQEGILGSIFEGSVTVAGETIFPSIKGSAYVVAEASLILDEQDPFCFGIRR